MNNFSTFEMKTAIHFGDNALDRLKEIPYKRVLIITDPFVVQSGMVDLITAPLNSAGIEYDIFCDVVPDAPLNKICLLYTSPSPRDRQKSRMPSSA